MSDSKPKGFAALMKMRKQEKKEEEEKVKNADVDTTAEAKFLSTCTYPDIELLFVGHHGSERSTGDAWLDAIAPDAAIISVGYNSYGHPTRDALLRLTDAGVTVYRTDLQGNIYITVN